MPDTSSATPETLQLQPLPAFWESLKLRCNQLSGVDTDNRISELEFRGLNDFGFDPFGLHPDSLRRVFPVVALLYRRYFRVDARGVEKIPSGPCMLVANHSGQLPLDGFMIGCAALLEGKPPRLVRGLVERMVPDLPFLSVAMARCGQVVATRENCKKLLADSELTLVFPEGYKGLGKTWSERYSLGEFGQRFLRLALEKGVPIVPVGVVGAEEQIPSLANVKILARLLGLPLFPLTPTFPLLGPLGLFPLPVRYRIRFGDPIYLRGSDDEVRVTVSEKVAAVQDAVMDRMRLGLEEREHVFW